MPAPGICRGTWRHVPETCLVLVDLMCRVPAGMYRGLVANLMYRGIYRVPGFSTSLTLVVVGIFSFSRTGVIIEFLCTRIKMLVLDPLCPLKEQLRSPDCDTHKHDQMIS